MVIEGVRCGPVCRSAGFDLIISGPGRGPIVTAAVGLVGARVVTTIHSNINHLGIKN